jgi:hypothetical protein
LRFLIQDAQAAGIKKSIPVYDTLYNNMSEDQKKNAECSICAPRPHEVKVKGKGQITITAMSRTGGLYEIKHFGSLLGKIVMTLVFALMIGSYIHRAGVR